MKHGMMKYNLKQITPPALEPVSLSDFKLQAHITFTEQDALYTSYLKAGRMVAEDYQRKSFITQIWELSLDIVPHNPIKLLRGPVQSLVSVKVYDGDNTESTVDNSNFFLDNSGDVARLSLTDDGGWPILDYRYTSCVVIRYTTGYGLTASEVPEYIKQAILLYASHMDDNRAGDLQGIPPAFYNLLSPGRIHTNEPW